jgi:hypothetical protein
MRYCGRCRFPIAEPESEKRKEWCGSIRRLLKIEGTRPEDYHEDCFLDALLYQDGPAKSARNESVRRQLGRTEVLYPSTGIEASHV